jgi:hypothetical protein
MPVGMDATEDAASRRRSRGRDALVIAIRATYSASEKRTGSPPIG